MKLDARCNTAKDRQQYITSWRSHIAELSRPALAADIPLEIWEDLRDSLYDMVNEAADNIYGEEE